VGGGGGGGGGGLGGVGGGGVGGGVGARIRRGTSVKDRYVKNKNKAPREAGRASHRVKKEHTDTGCRSGES